MTRIFHKSSLLLPPPPPLSLLLIQYSIHFHICSSTGVQQPVTECFEKIKLLNEIKTMKYNNDNIDEVIKIINNLPQKVECFKNNKSFPPEYEITEEAFHLVFDHIPSQFLKHHKVCNPIAKCYSNMVSCHDVRLTSDHYCLAMTFFDVGSTSHMNVLDIRLTSKHCCCYDVF